MENFTEQKGPLGLYDPRFEHDACGIGAVVDIKGRKSHQTVSDALSIVERLEHRAGKDAEGKTGDGVGIMLQISHRFFAKVADELNIRLGNEREYGVGMFFFPQNEHLRAQAMKLFELVTRKEGLEFLAWREVPVDPDAVGQKARDCMPAIWQCFIKKPAKVSKGIDFDRKLYIVRRVFEQASNGTYVPSLSSRTIVYKGMFLVHDLRQFYLDLQDEDYESAIGMVHSRFSTNTNPSWMRAHPNRFILHNGEINTIKGNTDAMLAREETISSPIMKEDMNKILPIINTSGSDSAMLDNALEFMVMNGMDLPLAVMITIPEPWENNKNISQKKRDFYQYYATMLEPWDGPAAIYDLKNANRHANINVKLVSEAGVGTIAAGVAKGGAQVILVSGYDGGTGAAPRNSIKDAGLPWELGIAETHQTLILNGLRTRVRIESDSKLLSGRDVAISCMLGAEEFGFGTSLLMTMGCVMMRVCNLDTCPMGICTQNPELRKHFRGKPEYIINYLTFVAQELREYMAKLGIRTIDELVGRTDLLHVKSAPADSRMSKMDLDCILHNPAIVNSNVHFQKEDTYDFHLEDTLDMKVLMKKFKLSSKTPQSVKLDVSNTDRAFGAIFGSEITRKYGSDLPDDVYTVHCTGAGGQSFGAFIPKGLTLELTGDCNDYMGKGLSGGKLVVRPPEGITFKPEENIIIGNVALYGATSGKAFVSGVAGERFCVRNSGAVAVVEGVGDHGCEYMTGGTVVVLGQTGKNFAAGMTGGIAYVLDENWDFYQRVNKETVSLEPVEHKYDVATLKELIREHVELTGSPRGKEILDDFSEFLPKFKKVLPYDYDHMLRVIASMEERGLDGEQAQIEAFYAVQKNK